MKIVVIYYIESFHDKRSHKKLCDRQKLWVCFIHLFLVTYLKLMFGHINGTQSAVGGDWTRDPVNTRWSRRHQSRQIEKDIRTDRQTGRERERERCLLATEGNKLPTVTGPIRADSWAASALPVTVNTQPYTVTHTGNVWRGWEHFCLSACLRDGQHMHQRTSLANIFKADESWGCFTRTLTEH